MGLDADTLEANGTANYYWSGGIAYVPHCVFMNRSIPHKMERSYSIWGKTEKEPLQETLACMSKCTVSGMGAETVVKVSRKECDLRG